ncbi:MAG: hypothetical protein ABH872_01950 [Candidatus Omnitrophota bacterium]
MKLLVFFMAAFFVFACIGITGCGNQGKKAQTSDEAINIAKAYEAVDQKVKYLISQAKAFYESQKFQHTLDIAQYILTNLDKDSKEAKDLLEKAKEALIARTKEAIDAAAGEVKKKIGDIGK